MKLNKFAYLCSKPLGNRTLKIMKKYMEIYWKTWKNHGNIMEFCQSEKVGTLLAIPSGNPGSATATNRSDYHLKLAVCFNINHVQMFRRVRNAEWQVLCRKRQGSVSCFMYCPILRFSRMVPGVGSLVIRTKCACMHEKFKYASLIRAKTTVDMCILNCLTSLTRAKCGTRSTLCWKVGNISGSTELFAL